MYIWKYFQVLTCCIKGFLRALCRNLLALFLDKNERYISGLKLKISVSLKLNTNK